MNSIVSTVQTSLTSNFTAMGVGSIQSLPIALSDYIPPAGAIVSLTSGTSVYTGIVVWLSGSWEVRALSYNASTFLMTTTTVMIAVVGNVFNVCDYGATGNGTTDDYAAISAATKAAGPNGVVFFPPGIFLTSYPLQPLTGQRWIGSGMCSDDSPMGLESLPQSPGTVITLDPSNGTDMLNFDTSALIDGLEPGQGQAPVTSVDDVWISDMLLNAQSQNLTGGFAKDNYAGCMRAGNRWRIERVHFYDGHWYHCFLGGDSCSVLNCEFSLGDGYQDTLSGGGSYHEIAFNRWNANCSWGAIQHAGEGGDDHNLYDNCGQTLTYLTYSKSAGYQAFGINFHDNLILSAQTLAAEAWADSSICNNRFARGGNIILRSNCRYGYDAFWNCQRVTVSGNVFFPLPSTLPTLPIPANTPPPQEPLPVGEVTPITVVFESPNDFPASPPTSPPGVNKGAPTAGGGIKIVGNSIYQPAKVGIAIFGDGRTDVFEGKEYALSFGGNSITGNLIHNSNTSGSRTTNSYEFAYTYVASIAIIGGWSDLLVEGNICIDPYGWNDTSPPSSPPPPGPAISYGTGAAHSYSPPGIAIFANNIIVGASPPILGIAPATSYALPTVRGNLGVNPAGNIASPAFPMSGISVANLTGYDVTIYLASTGGAITEVAIGNPTPVSTGLGIGTDPGYLTVRLMAGQLISVTYSDPAPTWTWFAE